MCTPPSLCSCVLLVDRDRLLVVYWKILFPQRTRTGMAAASRLWCAETPQEPPPPPRGAPCVLKGWPRVPVAIHSSLSSIFSHCLTTANLQQLTYVYLGLSVFTSVPSPLCSSPVLTPYSTPVERADPFFHPYLPRTLHRWIEPTPFWIEPTKNRRLDPPSGAFRWIEPPIFGMSVGH